MRQISPEDTDADDSTTGDTHSTPADTNPMRKDPQQTRTSVEAYRDLMNNEEDTILRKRVCAAIAIEPQTINEVTERFEDRSANSIRPRINELLLMGCVTRQDTRANPSGHAAYIHRVTPLGTKYLNGTADPDQAKRVSAHESEVVSVARQFTRGEATEEELTQHLLQHDAAKERMNPDWDGGLDLDLERPDE